MRLFDRAEERICADELTKGQKAPRFCYEDWLNQCDSKFVFVLRGHDEPTPEICSAFNGTLNAEYKKGCLYQFSCSPATAALLQAKFYQLDIELDYYINLNSSPITNLDAQQVAETIELLGVSDIKNLLIIAVNRHADPNKIRTVFTNDGLDESTATELARSLAQGLLNDVSYFTGRYTLKELLTIADMLNDAGIEIKIAVPVSARHTALSSETINHLKKTTSPFSLGSAYAATRARRREHNATNHAKGLDFKLLHNDVIQSVSW